MSPSELRPFQCWGETNMLGMIIGQLKGHELVQPKPKRMDFCAIPFGNSQTQRCSFVLVCLVSLRSSMLLSQRVCDQLIASAARVEGHEGIRRRLLSAYCKVHAWEGLNARKMQETCINTIRFFPRNGCHSRLMRRFLACTPGLSCSFAAPTASSIMQNSAIIRCFLFPFFHRFSRLFKGQFTSLHHWEMAPTWLCDEW